MYVRKASRWNLQSWAQSIDVMISFFFTTYALNASLLLTDISLRLLNELFVALNVKIIWHIQ